MLLKHFSRREKQTPFVAIGVLRANYIFNRSGSVAGKALELVKVAVKSLMDTLGENDFVNIAKVSIITHTSLGNALICLCYPFDSLPICIVLKILSAF